MAQKYKHDQNLSLLTASSSATAGTADPYHHIEIDIFYNDATGFHDKSGTSINITSNALYNSRMPLLDLKIYPHCWNDIRPQHKKQLWFLRQTEARFTSYDHMLLHRIREHCGSDLLLLPIFHSLPIAVQKYLSSHCFSGLIISPSFLPRDEIQHLKNLDLLIGTWFDDRFMNAKTCSTADFIIY